ncbi:hypothetical protein QYE76_009373 [Lolium multiflorum]|uniref:non-specific serine/threonine protein kinase n=1 Tax=Lolium multiflorum TaxID=4521 RepID=A0AAD8TRU2_LOLMU|nr:hypothetical protein QYE76_009373 [Lolium multiflorum]
MVGAREDVADDEGRRTRSALLGAYKLGRTLGEGSFGKVKHARRRATGEHFAVKIMERSKVLSLRGADDQVRREIATLTMLNHPNVVRLHEVAASKTKIYMVLEFVNGGELFDRIPENVLIDRKGNIKISDFGLSALPQHLGGDGLLHTTCGSPNYIAPEVLQNRGYDGSLSDIWSCGVILYIMLVGYLPFDDRNMVVLYQKIFKGDTHIPEWLSPSAQDLLRRILKPDPKKRINMAEIKTHEWFRKDYIPVAPYDDNDEDVQLGAILPVKEKQISEASEEKSIYQMNAFELIGMASSLDLSSLFEEEEVSQRKIRFTSVLPPKDLFDKIESSATVSRFHVQRVHSKLKIMHNCNRLNNPTPFLVCAKVFELGPSLYVVELKKSHGDTALYKQLCDRISSDLGIRNIFRTEPLFSADLPSFDSRAAHLWLPCDEC